MELALNVAWFIIASASYLLLVRRLANRGTEHARGLSRVQCIIALTCVLAILFPVISLTDDLYEMQATVEEASPSGMVMKRAAVHDPSTPIQTPNQLLFVVFSNVIGVAWAVLASIAVQQIPRSSPYQHLSPLGRAPPSFVCRQIA